MVQNLRNIRGIENLREYLGEELGDAIYKALNERDRMDKQLNILHKHIDIVQNSMTNIINDPVFNQLELAIQESANVPLEVS